MLSFAVPVRLLRFSLSFMLVVAIGASTHAADPVAWKFEPGLANRYRMAQETKVVRTGAGGDAQADSLLTIDTSWTVKEVKPDGSAVLDQKIERMRMKMSTGDGQQSEIDTAAEANPQGQAAMAAPLLKAITSHPFVVTMTPRGEVTDVVVPEAVVEALKNQPGAAQMGDLASAEGFKKMVSQASFVLPEKLEPDMEWTSKSEAKLPAVGAQTAVTTYRYVGPKELEGKHLEEFSAKIEISFAGGEVTVEVPSQESSGTILFNRDAGRLESSHIKQVTNMKITQLGQVVEQKIDQTVDVSWLPADAE